jgi:hypothetical protein
MADPRGESGGEQGEHVQSLGNPVSARVREFPAMGLV